MPARGGGVAVDQLGEQELDLDAQGLVSAGQVPAAGAFHDRAVKGQIGFGYRSPGSAGGQPAQMGPGADAARKLPHGPGGWLAAPPRRLVAPHRERSGAVAPSPCMAARPEPGSGSVLRAPCP